MSKPLHRWYTFPHSFTSDLVHALIDEWSLGPSDRVLDPFAGAGTTILACKEGGVPASGYDLSPLAVLASSVKVADYDLGRLQRLWSDIEEDLASSRVRVERAYPDLVVRALPGNLLVALDAAARTIAETEMSTEERGFFELALLAVLPQFSKAVATGGWLRWIENQTDAVAVLPALRSRVSMMLDDLRDAQHPAASAWEVHLGDARALPDGQQTFSAVITSPPYPNRHDYTRVFGVELMFRFLDWEKTRQLRYQTFHSHPEARPMRPDATGYAAPAGLTGLIARLKGLGVDPRVIRMLDGYFLDMYLCLKELKRVCSAGAKVAIVVGNTRYSGETVLVDELTADVGQQAGLTCERILAVRHRGNSAQQMGKYGRCPSRESIVVFGTPGLADDASTCMR